MGASGGVYTAPSNAIVVRNKLQCVDMCEH